MNAAWNIWNFRRPLVDALLADGHRVTVLAPIDDAMPKLEALGCTCLHLEMDVKGLNPLTDLKLLLRLRRHFRALQPDVVLSFTIKNNLFGALAAESLRIAFIPNVTGLGTAFLSGGLMERVAIRLYKTSFRNLQTVFFQNDDDKNLFLECGIVTCSQAKCLPGSGIDLERFAVRPYPNEGAAPVFLMIARLLRDKGVLEYVDAARRIKAKNLTARFQLLGAAGSENRTSIDRETVRAWEQDGLVEYLGTVEDVRPNIAAANCVVLPSYREGAPRTLIEAAAMARPIITTDVPGCRTVVNDGINGFLCDARSGDSLADACERFMSLTRGARVEMGQLGRAKMEREFSQSRVVDAYRTALSKVACNSDSTK